MSTATRVPVLFTGVVLGVHEVGVLACCAGDGVEPVRVAVDLVAEEEVVRVGAAEDGPCHGVVAIDADEQERLVVIALRLIRGGLVGSPVCCGEQNRPRAEAGGVGGVETGDVAIALAHAVDVGLLSGRLGGEVA